MADDDVKALPLDAKPITIYENSDSAWQEVYDGIKLVVEAIRTTFTAKRAFVAELQRTDLPSSAPISLEDVFVFPHLTTQDSDSAEGRQRKTIVSSLTDLLTHEHALVHGQEKSGKTALAKHITLSLVNEGHPVLFADLATATGSLGDKFLRAEYESQFHGEYSLWQQQKNKTLIVDNMTEHHRQLDFIRRSTEIYSRIYVFVSSDVFHSYLADEIRLAEFRPVRLEPLTRVQQEELIRNRLAVLDTDESLTDGFVDQAEDRVNSIILSNKIVPRYPFFVLSILQTYDAILPRSFTITSYGHCYYVFILSSLARAGIAESDDALNSAFNFAEQLALATFLSSRDSSGTTLDFADFQSEYAEEYHVEASIVNRLTHDSYGITTQNGKFRTAYMYYFFLGKLLATNAQLATDHLPYLCENSYDEGNYLTLLFAIHHATDDTLIEDILVRTMVELEDVPVATLGRAETSRFKDFVSALPISVLSDNSVADERANARRRQDSADDDEDTQADADDSEPEDPTAASMLRVYRNNKILGQVLRTQYGKLPKTRIAEIVQTIADSSFRQINVLLRDEEEIRVVAQHIHTQYPENDFDSVKQMLTLWSFMWTMMNIEAAVEAVNVPSIRETVADVVARNSTPAYEIFGYFYKLDSTVALGNSERDALAAVYKRHRDLFVKCVLSIRTQDYINTHQCPRPIEQSLCAMLGIEYIPRRKSR